MESRPVRLGIAGLGGHGRTIQRWANEVKGLDVVAVYDPIDLECEAATKLAGCKVASSYSALTSDFDLEAIAIVSPNHLHPRLTLEALDAGLHVLVEKPIANTVADGIQMVEAARSAGRMLMVGHNMRYNRASRKAKEFLDREALGRVVTVEMHFSANNTPIYSAEAWRLQPDLCPLLPITQLGVHGIDVLHYLVGRSTSVFASGRSVTTRPGVIDSVTAVIQTENGVAATMTSNYCTPVLFEIRVAGTENWMVYTPHSLVVGPVGGFQASADEPVERFDFRDNQDDGFEAEMKAFASALRGGPPIETTGEVGLQATAVDEAMRYSIKANAPVDIPDYLVEQIVSP